MIRTALIIIFFAGLFPSSTFSQPDYTRAIRAARDTVHSFMRRTKVPGVAVTVSVDGKTAWSEGFGYADLEQGVAVDPSKTKFRIASISKSITATGLAILFERGLIQLDSSVYFYVPSFPRKKYRPTIRQLAGHTGGIRYYRDDEFLISRHYSSGEEGLEVFQNDSLLFIPGTKYQYSSYGFNLLGVAMEHASGLNFNTLINNIVIKPLSLRNTVADVNDSLISNRGRFYDVQNGKILNSPYVDNSYKLAGGGFLSTSEDLVKFGNSYLHPGLLKRETIALFVSSQKFPDGKETGYGLGWSSRRDKEGRVLFGHSGGAIGGSSDLVIYPAEKIVVVILTNLSSAGIGNTTQDLAKLFMH